MKKLKLVSRSGRFAARPAAASAAFTQSVSYDWRLWEHDILGSIAHAAMLCKIGILTRREQGEITRGLESIARRIAAGKFTWRPELEDVHMNIEAELTRRVPAGAKLHTGRSRNDQVALDMRMWVREEIMGLTCDIRRLQGGLVDFGRAHAALLIPGYTHLQRAQPVYLAHHLLAYVEMLERDCQRLTDTFDRVNICPLGSGALAGSTLPLDRHHVAELLGFVDCKGKPRISRNSMDAVSDRDFVVEFCGAAALLAVHLSRFAEDLVLWSGTEFNFIRISDAYTTGSSLMPQKKNPDVAELVRGKSGRVIGNLVALLTLLKGLPMTYNRDLQEDKERLFDTADTVRSSVRILADMIPHIAVHRPACEKASADPALVATDLADYLVRKRMPFRQAHHIVGSLVAHAEQSGCTLDQLSLAQFQAANPAFGPDIHEIFDLQKAMARRALPGAPGTREVAKELARWTQRLRSCAVNRGCLGAGFAGAVSRRNGT